MNITVLGAGNWGTTAALLLHGNGHHIHLWEFNTALADAMNEHRENRVYLPEFPLPDDLLVTSRLDEALDNADAIVFVVPSSVMRQTAAAVRKTGAVQPGAVFASLSKGLEYETLKTMTEIIGDEIGGHPLVALSGPCIAGEVAHRQPTTIVSASEDQRAAELMQDAFMTERFRVYTSDDPHGVQFGGALKNIIAIAAGINDGLGFGANAKSALVTRGIVEMKRFAEFEGAKPDTFNGLSGVGDLITTCFSPSSRNRSLGERIARGEKLDDIMRDMVMVAEGVYTARAVYHYARQHNIEMPITGVVYHILYDGLSPQQGVNELMLRDRKSEL